MHCIKHINYTDDCEDCKKLRALVEKYQCHRHTFTCKKKGKVIKILPGEGHGRLDGQLEGEMLLEPVCRFKHPKNPMDRTEFVFPFPENVGDEELKRPKLTI